MATPVYNVNVTVNNNYPNNQQSNVPYSQLPDPVNMNGDYIDEQYHPENEDVDESMNDIPKSNKPLRYFILGYSISFIAWIISTIIQVFDAALISILLMLIVSAIAVKWIDRGCLCIACARCSLGGVNDYRLTLIWLHFLATIIVGICGIIYYELESDISALIGAIATFVIAQGLGIMALWKKKRVQY